MSSSSKLTPKEMLSQENSPPPEKARTSSFRFPSFFRSNSTAATEPTRPSNSDEDDESGGDEDSGDEDVQRKRSFSDDEGNDSESSEDDKLEISIPSPAKPLEKGVVVNENPIKAMGRNKSISISESKPVSQCSTCSRIF